MMSMRWNVLSSLVALSTLGCPWSTVGATSLLASDFRDGKLTGWTVTGIGTVRQSTAEHLVALELGPGASAITRLSASGYRQIVVTLAFAGSHLGPNGACIAEVSIDEGGSWLEAARLNSGEDDGATRYRNGARIGPRRTRSRSCCDCATRLTSPRHSAGQAKFVWRAIRCCQESGQRRGPIPVWH
jgi:hypothetical protein